MINENSEGGNIINPEKFMEIMPEFKAWSGLALVKIFDDSGSKIKPLGSGGLVNYKGRYFVVTNEHVVRSVPKGNRAIYINIPYADKDAIDRKMIVINDAENKDNDLAAFEISEETVNKMNEKSFLSEENYDLDIEDYINDISNVIFVHGYAVYDTQIDHMEKTIDMVTTPYQTTVAEYDQYAEILNIHSNQEGISEYGEEIEVSTFSGMSGSLVFGLYMEPGGIDYKAIGILSEWEKSESKLLVFPFKDITNFLDESFFSDN
ncbi:hypothetical protein [Guptibacillus spartinae]|uniref:hypothetical protein n=1 Tax=Guptibacillus spartinae TaxID=3025679 RepID=UPI00235EF171|nr:hypothetical protein [Pseudalkalibacillus spartinae]